MYGPLPLSALSLSLSSILSALSPPSILSLPPLSPLFFLSLSLLSLSSTLSPLLPQLPPPHRCLPATGDYQRLPASARAKRGNAAAVLTHTLQDQPPPLEPPSPSPPLFKIPRDTMARSRSPLDRSEIVSTLSRSRGGGGGGGAKYPAFHCPLIRGKLDNE